MFIFILIFAAAALAAVIMQLFSRKTSRIGRAFAFLSSAVMFFALFMVCVTAFYCVKEPVVKGIRELTVSFSVPICINLVLLACLFPFLLHLLPQSASKAVRSCFQDSNYLSVLMFSLWSFLLIDAKDSNIEVFGTAGAYFYNSKLLLLNLCIVLSVFAAMLLLRKINSRRVHAFFFYSNRMIYAAIPVVLGLSVVFIPGGAGKLKQSFSFAINRLLLSCAVTAAVSFILCLIRKNKSIAPDDAGKEEETERLVMKPVADERSFGKKLLIAFLPVLFAVSELILFKPFEIFLLNQREFDFQFRDFYLLFIACTLLTAVVISLLAALLKGKVYDICVSLLFAAGIALWIQGSFLNPDLGLLDGSRVLFSGSLLQIAGNTAIWLAVFLCCFLLVKFSAQWSELVSIVSVGLFAIQVFSVCMIPSRNAADSPSEADADPAAEISELYYVDNKTQFQVSPVENTVVIILDCCSSSFIDDMLKVYPDALDFMTDFTYYDNYEPCYYKTYPSMTHMLTGNPLDPTVSVASNFKASWESSSADDFYSALHDNGFKTFLYGYTEGQKTMYGELGQMFGKIDNVIRGEDTTSDKIINRKELLRRFVRLSSYVCLPNISKQYYYITTDDLTAVTSSSNIPLTREFDYYDHLKSSGLTLESGGSSKYLIVQHLASIYDLSFNENCEEHVNNTPAQTAKGCMVLLEEYVRQLKELGVYDNTNIIVTADHGGMYAHTQCIFFIKEKGRRNDQLVISHAPVSSNELLPTILYNSGLDPEDIGMTIYDIDEDTPRERTHISVSWNSDYPDVPKYNSTINANHNEYICYTYTGDRKTIEELVLSGQYSSIPMVDCYE